MCTRSAFHISNTYTSGWIGALISFGVAIVVYFSVRVFVQIAAYTRRPLLASIWSEAFGNSFSPFWACLSVVAACLRVALIVTDVIRGVGWLFERRLGELPLWLMDEITIALLVWVIAIVPLSFVRSLESAIRISAFAIIFVVFVAIHQSYSFISRVYSVGFDPEGRSKFCVWSPAIFGCIANVYSGYEIAPITSAMAPPNPMVL
jgi:hypothetical protein